MQSGAYGIQRKQMINNMFKGIIELSFPNFVKHLFHVSKTNKGLFEAEEVKQEQEALEPLPIEEDLND